MGDGVAVADAGGNMFIFNPAARRITGLGPMGRTPEEWIETYGIYLPDGSAPCAPEDVPLARALRGESTDRAEFLLRNPEAPDGVWIDVTGRPLLDADGRSRGGVVVFRDVTAGKRMLEELQRAEAKYRALVEQLPVVAYTSSWSPLGAMLYVSPQMEAKLGFSIHEWLCEPDLWVRRLHPEDRERVTTAMRRCQTTGERFVAEYRMLARDGRTVWFHDEGVVLRDAEGNPAVLQGVMIDVTDRQEERAGRLRLAALSSDLVALQEAERRSVATLLHDEVGQLLTGLKLQLGSALGEPEAADSRARFADANRLVSELIVRVRELSLELRPTVLDDHGVLAALGWHFDRYMQRTGILVRFAPEGLEGRRFPPRLETAAFRLVQEALENVEHHAGVREVWVRAWATETDLCVQVQDAGRGFDAARVVASAHASGLIGMRERVLLLGGEFIVEAAPGQGTQVTAEIPIAGDRG
jgi:two-component system sensor histidine kinase UhpB